MGRRDQRTEPAGSSLQPAEAGGNPSAHQKLEVRREASTLTPPPPPLHVFHLRPQATGSGSLQVRQELYPSTAQNSQLHQPAQGRSVSGLFDHLVNWLTVASVFQAKDWPLSIPYWKVSTPTMLQRPLLLKW